MDSVRSRARWRFWAVAYVLLILLTGTNLATPLYRGYQQRFGFSPLVVTLVFAVYVAVLIPSLLVAGPLSDVAGRRRVLVPAVLLAAVAAVLFAVASGTGWLVAARVLQGVSTGAASGPLTAALTELEPGGDRRRAALVSTVGSMGGLGLGPLVAGALAQYGPAPRVLPFVLEVVLLAVGLGALRALPASRPGGRWRPRRPSLPAAVRPAFLTSGVATFLAFAVIGLFLALVPSYVAELSGSANLLLGGAAVALLLLCSVLAQLAGYGRSARGLELVGLPVLAAGLGTLAVAGTLASLPLLLAATALAGVGQGLAYLGGLTAVNAAAPAGRHADVLSSYYVLLYLGVGVPVIGVGLLATETGLLPAVRWFAAVVAVLSLAVAAVRLPRRAPARRPAAGEESSPAVPTLVDD